MAIKPDVVLELAADSVPADVLVMARQQLIDELNQRAPIAVPVQESTGKGAKGSVELAGQVGLALLSGGLLNYISQVIIEFVRRNNRFSIKIDGIEVTKDNASTVDMENISKQLTKLMAARSKSI